MFDAHMIRALVFNDRTFTPDELTAFDAAFQGRRFRMLTTPSILEEYRKQANIFPPFQQQLVPTIDRLNQLGRIVHFDERRLDRFLNRSNIQLVGLRQEHLAFVHDAIAAGVAYCVTNRQEWLRVPDMNENLHGLQIVTPARFAQLEG